MIDEGGGTLTANIEFKAKNISVTKVMRTCREYGMKEIRSEEQCDTYFAIRRGRLKLRIVEGRNPSLISYNRSNRASARVSEWFGAVYRDLADPPLVRGQPNATIQQVLLQAIDEYATVTKKRTVFSDGTTLVNIDRVEGLGTYVEVEVNVARVGSISAARRLSILWKRRFCIKQEQMESLSYSDLLRQKKARPRRATITSYG